MAKIYSLSGYVRTLSDNLKSIEKEFEAARKLGWHHTCVALRNDAKALKRIICRESRIAGTSLIQRLIL